MLWEVDIHPRQGLPDRDAEQVVADAADLGVADALSVRSARGFLIESPSLDTGQVEQLATQLFADALVEEAVSAPAGDTRLAMPPKAAHGSAGTLVHVLLKPGVMDPVAQSAEAAAEDFGFSIGAIRTLRKYWVDAASDENLNVVSNRILANDAIEQVVVGPLPFDRLHMGSDYQFELRHVTLSGLDDDGVMQLSRTRPALSAVGRDADDPATLAELGREPTDVELETLAQTWSEHCSHKTLAGRIAYRDEQANGNSRTCSRKRSSPRPSKLRHAGATTIGA